MPFTHFEHDKEMQTDGSWSVAKGGVIVVVVPTLNAH